MRILIANDDGITANGIKALAEVFSAKHEVTVVAPSVQRSACSHGLATYELIKTEKISAPYPAYACGGTPADCVKIGILQVLGGVLPDVIISGINNGKNLGNDVIYSGTVAAAAEGSMFGVRSIAISACADQEYGRLLEVANFLEQNLEHILAIDIPITTVININYPLKRPIIGVKTTKTCRENYIDVNAYYADGFTRYFPSAPNHKDEDCDIYWSRQGYITVSPLQNDRNDYKALANIKNGDLVFPAAKTVNKGAKK